MNEFHLEIFDSHFHLDIILEHEGEGIRDFFRKNSMGGIIWSFNKGLYEPEELIKYFERLHKISCDFQKEGIPLYYLVGIHPRCLNIKVPALEGLSKYLESIYKEFLSRKECLGLGEIGLEKGTEEEERYLRAQLELETTVNIYGKRIGIHTPRRDKERITFRTLEIIRDYPYLKENILVDHCTPNTIGMVLSEGFWAGVTMSPVKCQMDDLIDIIERFPEKINKICINTDASEIYHDLLRIAGSDRIEESIKSRLLRENALEFWKVPLKKGERLSRWD